MPVTPCDFDDICALVRELCGVSLDSSKAYLLDSRLSALLKTAGCQSLAELAQRARLPHHADLRNDIVDAITTNETSFFREAASFDALKCEVLPEILRRKAESAFSRRLRIWSAACSYGQEPYSIAMTLAETIPDWQAWDIAVTATDVSLAAINKARLARYSNHEVERGIPTGLLEKYFEMDDGMWQLSKRIRRLVQFQQMNLLAPFRELGVFDIVFCRNVAIYFNAEDRLDRFRRLRQVLSRDGYLFVGSAESLDHLRADFRPQHFLRAGFYRPQPPKPGS